MDDSVTLAQVDAAIQKVLQGGQSYTLGQRQVTRANLQYLMQLRREMAAQEATGADDPQAFPRTSVAIFDRR